MMKKSVSLLDHHDLEMLAPIITKDMKLFPTKPLPSGIKNVRLRAQSLDQVNQQLRSQSMRGRVAPIRPRVSQSVGNLPIAGQNGQKSPPRQPVTRKSTLNPIAEGIEMKEEIKPETASACELTRDGQERTERLRSPMARNGKDFSEDKGKENIGEIKIKDQKERNRVIRWITNALRSKSKSDSQDESLSTNST